MGHPRPAGGLHDGIERRNQSAGGSNPANLIPLAQMDVRLAIGDDDHTDTRKALLEKRHQAIAGPFCGLGVEGL